jgi:hypothetical protein
MSLVQVLTVIMRDPLRLVGVFDIIHRHLLVAMVVVIMSENREYGADERSEGEKALHVGDVGERDG